MPPQRTPAVGVNRGAATPSPGGVREGAASAQAGANNKRKDSCLEQIQLLQKKRDERRKSMEDKRKGKAHRLRANGDVGIRP
jgi:hypothetical protein